MSSKKGFSMLGFIAIVLGAFAVLSFALTMSIGGLLKVVPTWVWIGISVFALVGMTRK
jgi:hypothetical protein